MATVTGRMTAEELLRSAPDAPCELVRGEIIAMSPANASHGVVAARIIAALLHHVEARGLGMVFASETGFVIERSPDTVRAPDAAFVVKDRTQAIRDAYFDGAPDLAVEVLSPSDRAGEIEDKVEMWLRSGASVVWVVDPKRRSAAICRLIDGVVKPMDIDVLVDEPLLGDFRLPIDPLFVI